MYINKCNNKETVVQTVQVLIHWTSQRIPLLWESVSETHLEPPYFVSNHQGPLEPARVNRGFWTIAPSKPRVVTVEMLSGVTEVTPIQNQKQEIQNNNSCQVCDNERCVWIV